MPDKLFMPTHPSSPFSHAYTHTHHQRDSSPPGLAQWACYIKASEYGSRVGWTPARTIHTYNNNWSYWPNHSMNMVYAFIGYENFRQNMTK